MTEFHALILAALALHIVVLATLAALVLRYRRRWHMATERADSNARFANGAVAKLTDVNANFRSLENTLADTSRLLTDAQGTIGLLEQLAADAVLMRDVALHAGRVATDAVTQAQHQVTDAEAHIALRDQVIADLEARLVLPEPTPSDLVLLDAAARPERLQDAPVDVPEGCRVETVRYHTQTRVRGPGGRFVSRARAGDSEPPGTTNYMGGGGGEGFELKDNPVEPGSTITVTIGGEPEDRA